MYSCIDFSQRLGLSSKHGQFEREPQAALALSLEYLVGVKVSLLPKPNISIPEFSATNKLVQLHLGTGFEINRLAK